MSDSVEFASIRVEGIIEEEVGSPRNDGTRGSGLYDVPVRLSANAPREWGEYFSEDLGHRYSPLSVTVGGKRAVVRQTTIDTAVKHRSVMETAAENANVRYAELLGRRRDMQKAEAGRRTEHREHVAEVLKESGFKAPGD